MQLVKKTTISIKMALKLVNLELNGRFAIKNHRIIKFSNIFVTIIENLLTFRSTSNKANKNNLEIRRGR